VLHHTCSISFIIATFCAYAVQLAQQRTVRFCTSNFSKCAVIEAVSTWYFNLSCSAHWECVM